MNDDKWQNLVNNLEDKFPDLEKTTEKIESSDDLGKTHKKTLENLIFDSPLGKIKITRVTAPLIIDKKYHYTHTQSGKGKVEYILSENEKTQKLHFYQWNKLTNDWEEMSTREEFLSF